MFVLFDILSLNNDSDPDSGSNSDPVSDSAFGSRLPKKMSLFINALMISVLLLYRPKFFKALFLF